MNIETIVAVIAIVASSLFSGVALIFNYVERKQANRISVANRYSEVSRMLSEEICVRVDIIKNLQAQMEKQSEEQVAHSNAYIEKQRGRMKEIDELQKDIKGRIKLLHKDDPAEIEQHVLVNYSQLASAKRTLEQMQGYKNA